MDGTGSVKRTVRANALRHPASSVGAAESKDHSGERIQLSGGGGTSYCTSSLLGQYKELRAMVIFSLPHFLKWAIRNGYWHCHFGEGAEGFNWQSRKISQRYSKCKMVPFNCCSLTLKAKRSCKVPLAVDVVNFPDMGKKAQPVFLSRAERTRKCPLTAIRGSRGQLFIIIIKCKPPARCGFHLQPSKCGWSNKGRESKTRSVRVLFYYFTALQLIY